MAEYELNLCISNQGTRNDVRMSVVNELSKEVAGAGRDALSSRYTYYVEELDDGRRIYLRRPANLHNGFDFVVCVEGINFNPSGRMRNFPKHDDIIADLESKYAESPSQYRGLFEVIKAVYQCEEPNWGLVYSLSFSSGYSCELIVKVLKWLFIEQDIRYWNYSGRDMLWNGIQSITPDF